MLPKKAVVDSFLKARGHLEYSLAKVKAMKMDSPLGEQHLETLESFACWRLKKTRPSAARSWIC